MSKQIYLYSEDKKYKCGVELADSTDHFGCPEHSIMILTEERENGTYVIAEARDKLLETEKDKELERLKKYDAELHEYIDENELDCDEFIQNQKAIEELEKLLVHCKENFNWFENTEYKEGYDNEDISNAYFDIQCVIEDRIKELKGE